MRRLALLVAASGLLFNAPAYAGGAASSDVACGSSAVYWNAPNGAVVFNRGNGALRDVISAVGESRTHSMLSNASVKYVTHAVAKVPDRPSDYCDTPLDPGQLERGWAGAEQINQGAIYTYLYANGSQEFVYYQNGNGDGTNKGGAIANWAWSSMPYVSVASWRNSSSYLYRLKNTAGNPINYVLYQFRNQQNSSWGGSNWNDGAICSTLLATLQARAIGSQINTWTYSHGQVNTALNALYNGVYNQCDANNGFWTGVGAFFTCGFDFDLCDEAADQVSNCMADGSCGTSKHSIWTGVANDGAVTATTMSPDHIGGWNGHPYTGSGVSVWAYDGSNSVQWASSGNVYGCWY